MADQGHRRDQKDQAAARVLSIQSHVVSGYCGNKSAVFPLQLLGFEVDAINSVQFSTHTGYPRWTGQVLHEAELLELFEGLKANQLHSRYTHLLTGYARSKSFLEAVHKVVGELKTASPGILYLCDPVLGDDGQLYVPEELVSVYRDKIIPLADLICPNQFEAEMLTGVKIVDMASAIKAIDRLHQRGIRTVVMSSSERQFAESDGGRLLVAIGSSRMQPGPAQRYTVTVPRLEARFTGTGDLFAALFLAWFSRTGYNMRATLERVVATMQSVIEATYQHAQRQPGGLQLAQNRELLIIQSRAAIETPPVSAFRAVPVPEPAAGTTV